MENLHKVKGETFGSEIPAKEVRILPTFQLTEDDLPDIKDWEVGKKYLLVMEVEEIAMREGSEWQGAEDKEHKMHATFKITKVGAEEPEGLTYSEEFAQRMSPKP